jgi:hypothetical protein
VVRWLCTSTEAGDIVEEAKFGHATGTRDRGNGRAG